MHIEFETTDAMAAELTRMMRVLDAPVEDVFRRAFSLLRIHVDAEQKGLEIVRRKPDSPVYELIELPYPVKGA